MSYQSPSQVGTWNGWDEPIPPAPTFPQMHDDLTQAIDRELAEIPIEQQTVIVAVVWDIDSWGVEVLTAPPTGSRYDGWTDCLIDFDQYIGSTKWIRQSVAEALADELIEQTFPGWRNPDYGKPEPPAWEEWN